MNINRYNYEEFFLLYVDNELSKAERLEVEAFVHDNPDLEEELVMLKQSTLRPDHVQFEGKATLMKPETSGSFISEANYEEFFLLYIDNELDANARRSVEEFSAEHPALQQELNILLQTKAEPDHAVVFPDKSLLYKESETEKRPIIIRLWRIAAVAAVILLALGIFWISGRGTTDPDVIAKKEPLQNNTGKNQAETHQQAKKADKEEAKEQPVQTQQETAAQQQLASGNKTDRADDKVTRRHEEAATSTRQLAHNNEQKKDEAAERERTLAKVDVPPIRENAAGKNIGTGLETANLTSAVKAIGDPIVQTVADMGNAAYFEETEDVYIANTTVNRKLRGVFRKVTRVFGKTTNLPAVEEKGILIGGFEIALK